MRVSLQPGYYAYYFKKQKYHETISSIATSQHNLATFLSELGYNWIALFYEQKAMTVRQSINNDDGSELLNLASSLLRLGIIYAEIYKKYYFSHFKKLADNYLTAALKKYNAHCNNNSKANCEKEISKCKELIKELDELSRKRQIFPHLARRQRK